MSEHRKSSWNIHQQPRARWFVSDQFFSPLTLTRGGDSWKMTWWQGGGGGLDTPQKWWRHLWTAPNHAQRDIAVWGYLYWPGPPPPRSSPGAGPSGGGDVPRWRGRSLFEEKLYPNTCLIAKITIMSEMNRFKRWRRLQTYFGLLSPAKPALVMLEPLSRTRVWTFSHILSRKVLWLLTSNSPGRYKLCSAAIHNIPPPRLSCEMITRITVLLLSRDTASDWNVKS